MNAAVKTVEPTADDYKRIAESILRVGDVGKRLAASGLSRRAILVLLRDATNLPMGDIKLVLDALPQLSKFYLSAQSK